MHLYRFATERKYENGSIDDILSGTTIQKEIDGSSAVDEDYTCQTLAKENKRIGEDCNIKIQTYLVMKEERAYIYYCYIYAPSLPSPPPSQEGIWPLALERCLDPAGEAVLDLDLARVGRSGCLPHHFHRCHRHRSLGGESGSGPMSPRSPQICRKQGKKREGRRGNEERVRKWEGGRRRHNHRPPL